ncbi:MAG: hypothetical protein IJ719_14600 [Clostridia bacterium]|nr:hypothetical protein [Clostridia bacterium]
MRGIIINLNNDGIENRADIIRLLSTLLSTTETVKKRKQILADEFHIPMTKEIEEGMQDMCNYGSAIQSYGELTGQVKLIVSTMRKNDWDVEKTMDFMDVEKKDRPILTASVRKIMQEQNRKNTEKH